MQLSVKDILQAQGTNTINRIGGNILKAGITYAGINRTGQNISGSKHGANASGKTIQSMKVTATDTELIISGREKFSNLETGVLPGTMTPPATLYTWSKFKGIPFKDDKKRFFFAQRAANKINANGSLLYRFGGRRDIYTNEVEPLMKAIADNIEQRFYEIKLIE